MGNVVNLADKRRSRGREAEQARLERIVEEASARFNARHSIDDRVRAAAQSPAGVLAMEEYTLQLLEQAVSALRARTALQGRV